MNAINLGSLYIPVIVPQKGKDYYTETEKEEFITEITNSINEIVEPQEETRQENETARVNAEAIRQINENSRIVSEESRLSAEETRESNETTRQTAEETRNTTFQEKIQAVDNAIAQIEDLSESYNQNATQKTRDFNNNASNKTNSFNNNCYTKLSAFDRNAIARTEEFDSHTQEIQNRLSNLETAKHSHSNKSILDNTTASYTAEEKNKLAGLENYDDTEIQEDIEELQTNKENISNKVTELTSESTDTQYPSAKAVYDNESTLKEKLDRYKNTIETELGDSTDTGTELSLNGTAEFDIDLGFSGNTYQETTEGYQLFDKDNATVKSMNSAASVGDTSTYSTATNQKHVFIQCKPNTIYKVKKDISDIAVLGIYETAEEPAVGVIYKTLYFTSNSSGVATVTTGENANYLDLRLNTNPITSEVLQKILDSILIYEGSDTKPYEKYTGKNSSPNPEFTQTVHVVKGSNELKIFNKNHIAGNKTNTSRGITTTLKNNTLKITGTTTGNWWTGIENNADIPIGDWTLSIQKVLPFTLNLILTLEDETTQNISISKGNLTATANITSKATKYNINFASAETGVTYDETIQLQLEKGTTATEYEETQAYPITLPEGMEMCGIENYRDGFVIDLSTGQWYKNKKIQKYIFDGTESWNYNTTNNYFNLVNIGPVRDLTQLALSNKYIFDNRNSGYGSLSNNRFALQVYNNRLTLFVKDERFDNADSFKGDLANINLVMYYPLATPVLEPIEDTILIGQLNNIKQAYTYQGQTNISQTNEDLPFIIKADFKLSNLSRIEALENALETVSSRVDLLEE